MRQSYTILIPGVLLAGLILFTSCRATHKTSQANYEVAKIEGSRICMDSTWDVNSDTKAKAILNSYKEKVDKMMYEVIGVSEMKMDKGRPESLLSNLVAEVLRISADCVLKHPADIGVMNMGGLRNILPAGNITVDAVYEILPFENSLCVLTMNGAEIKNLLTVIASQHGEGLSGAQIEITKDGKLLNATVQGKLIEENREYTVATIDYLADGNGGLTPFLQADKRECPDSATLRELFLKYVKQQTASGKKITSKLDGRITIVPVPAQK
ncbi:5'-nucleotidase C-terminal domain-containing protein [Bacteroides sp.]|uniref:5'-nucleotidase C-terminal domain-containing protein n=1 Tax=Bacteroides sp. TaxID=29523 RepID=UPI0026289FF4|nr:5'-nucleotidase [Bacteroides sp.]MDD3040609.1 5'-nucleotidase [Bacteroides sp.]